MACARPRQIPAGIPADEEMIQTLLDNIDALTLNERAAEQNSLEIKHLANTINSIPDIYSEASDLDSMDTALSQIKIHFDQLVTLQLASAGNFPMSWNSKRDTLMDKTESEIQRLTELLDNKRTRCADAVLSKRNSLRRIEELQENIATNQTDFDAIRRNEMESARKRREELQNAVAAKQIEVDCVHLQVNEVKNAHTNEIRELREQNKIEVNRMRKQLLDGHANDMQALRKAKAEIENMRKKIQNLKKMHANEVRNLREKTKQLMDKSTPSSSTNDRNENKNQHQVQKQTANQARNKNQKCPRIAPNNQTAQTPTQTNRNNSNNATVIQNQISNQGRSNQSRNGRQHPGPSNGNSLNVQGLENPNQSANQNENENQDRKLSRGAKYRRNRRVRKNLENNQTSINMI